MAPLALKPAMVELGQGLAAARARGQRLLEPGVELAHRRAVVLHRGAHVGGFGVALAAFQQRAWIDRLDDLHAGRHALAQAERDAPRVDEQRRVRRQRSDGRPGFGVRRELHAVGGEPVANVVRHLACGDEQPHPVALDQRMGEEHRVVVDVAAAQVEQPRHVVDGRDQMVRRAGFAHRLAHAGELVAARRRGFGRQVLVDGSGGQRRPVGPGVGEHVDVGA
jgi:hypothetical protein